MGPLTNPGKSKVKYLKPITRTIVSVVFFILLAAETTQAVLKPEEVVVVVNTGSPDSVRLGKLYTELCGIPSTHIAEITVPFQDVISREKYDELIAAPLKKAIDSLQDNGGKIRCIVTTYGVPLRIGPVKPPGVSGGEINTKEDILGPKKDELARLKERPKWWNKFIKKPVDRNYIKQLQNEVHKLQFELNHLKGHDTTAAVDSELAMLFFPPYPLAGWQVNPEAIYARGKINNAGRILMVSRLDATEPRVVENMIRTAVEVEKTGLTGRFYLDARGLTGKGAYGEFDEAIRKTAAILEKGSMPVVLDNKPALFGPGDAPDAALYCGWYSLGKYVDAFQWAKGAVGYHVASSEAVSLHNKKSNYWVKSMLERGVIASLGPVTEPYLTAFPPPYIFFQLLMSGQYSLAEVFAMSDPFLSWQMILVGDPLYNPFKHKPAYPLKDPPPPPG